MAVYVWAADGEYVGEVSFLPPQIGGVRTIWVETEGHREKIIQALLRRKHLQDGDFITIVVGGEKFSVEFPGDEWLDVASLLLLPREGYRVHVVAQPRA